MELTYEKRLRDALESLEIIIPGAIYYVHFKTLRFGHHEKPYHYALSVYRFHPGINYVKVHCCTSRYYHAGNAAAFRFNLLKDTTVKTDNAAERDTYAIFHESRFIPVDKFSDGSSASYRGKMNEGCYKEFLEAKRNFLLGLRKGNKQ